ncbi:MAG: aldo/keto reductase, partial [Verrucomicrobiae bacterium]|nr:aldo/keto reductase [Verrucomicrobiae bacterium]
MKRRTFLKTVGGAAGATVILRFPFITKSTAAETTASALPLPKRDLGKTGLKISTAGFSGFALNKYDQDECNRGIRSALDKGINYFDVAPAYGESEVRMGIALQGVD